MYRCALDLASVGRIAAAAFGIVGRENLGDIAVGVFHAAGAGDEICTLQAALGAFGIKPFILGNGNFKKILGFDPQIAREGDLSRSGLRIVGVILNIKLLALPLGIVRYRELYRAEDRHRALSVIVQILAQAVLKEGKLDSARNLCNADPLTEIADRLRRVSAAAQTAQRRHARIVPAGDKPFLDKPSELALAQNGVVYAKARKLDLARL